MTYSISHQNHPARRQGKGTFVHSGVKFALVTGKSLAIGTADVNTLYDRLIVEFPDAKLTKHEHYVLVENEK